MRMYMQVISIKTTPFKRRCFFIYQLYQFGNTLPLYQNLCHILGAATINEYVVR